ncbi:MAG: hypothetical protein GEU93_12510 [Propionibacteriales bacterium]|nr:hypothetical protein [Propionibacteriales bacterium]
MGTPGRGGVVQPTRLLFLISLTGLAAAYTLVAFGMDWRVQNGQIGPGFFPRLVGGTTVVGCLTAIALSVLGRRKSSPSRPPPVDAEGQFEPVGNGDGRRTDAWVTVLAVVCMIVFYLVLEPLGALLSSVLFLGLMLTLVNRGHHRLNAVVSVLVPVGLYLLFEVMLDAGLPPGLVLPL